MINFKNFKTMIVKKVKKREEESTSKTSLYNQYIYTTEHSSDYDEFEL